MLGCCLVFLPFRSQIPRSHIVYIVTFDFRIKKAPKFPRSKNFILKVEESLAVALGVEAGKWRIRDKISEAREHCGLVKILIREQRGCSLECQVCGVGFDDKEW